MEKLLENGRPFTVNARGQKVDEDGFATSRFTFITTRRTCVAVKINDGSVQLRDTKDPNKTTLTFNREEWEVFLWGVKSGEFDL